MAPVATWRALPLALWAALALAMVARARAEGESEPVTCGSHVKLQSTSTDFRLHSHEISWGGGSGQQSVTAIRSGDDNNSVWVVREELGARRCRTGAPVGCGSVVRLVHLKTGKLLHSHNIVSMLSRRQEVSCFGNYAKAESDSGDNWRVDCAGASWLRGQPVRLQHVGTGAFLYTDLGAAFNQQNCPRCPIHGQLEVSGLVGAIPGDRNAQWQTNEGVYFAPAPGDGL